MKGEGSVVQGERRGVAGAACVALLWMGVWDATWGRERTPEHDRVFWESVECTVAAEVEAYLSEFPEGRYERDARACLDDLGLGRDEEEEWAERERRLELSREERRRIQEVLEGLGLKPGGVDGWFGERTREAIRRWEASRGREETGYLDVESARELLAAVIVRSRFRDCDECPELVVVASGSYRMGSPLGEAGRWDDEGPVHRVSIGEALAVGVYEVTFEEWDACVRDGGCGGYRPNDWGWGRGRRPVMNVSWEDAQAYVRWLRGKTGKGYRLLSESEWEYVARAGTRTYWWGDELGRGRANCDGCGSRWDNKKTAPVGSFGGNGFGLHDVHGNVREWVEDCWNGSYRGAPVDGSAWTRGDCGKRVLRGGSWNSEPRGLRSANRSRYTTGSRVSYAGFRIVRTL